MGGASCGGQCGVGVTVADSSVGQAGSESHLCPLLACDLSPSKPQCPSLVNRPSNILVNS